ncbi:MAG: hypothetical protein ABFC80_06070 [Coriobacteriales bacterium]|nr:hypothetical protein [Actinomycetes bacterium]
MDSGVLDTVLRIAGIVVAALVVYGVITLVVTLKELRATMDELREKLVPLLDKADVAVDAINAELLRIDGIVTDVESVSGAVTSATDMIRTPGNVLAGVGGRIARAISRARR